MQQTRSFKTTVRLLAVTEKRKVVFPDSSLQPETRSKVES
jgi:hypothetical protein